MIRRNGLSVCSHRNPQKEATEWQRSVQGLLGPFGGALNAVIIFGGGAGYHLEALAEQYPDLAILVFDPSKELYEGWLNRVKNQTGSAELLQRVQWGSDVAALLQNQKVAHLRALTFKPAWQGAHAEFIDAVKKFKKSQSEKLKTSLASPEDQLLYNLLMSCVRQSGGSTQCA